MPTAAAGGGRYITHGGELVGTPPILSRTRWSPVTPAVTTAESWQISCLDLPYQ